jgi:superfamily II DNA or RNA helicase
MPSAQGGDLFIVDNSDTDWKVLQYLQGWAPYAHTIDIATGFFEAGALLALDGAWQKVDHLRILMGDETSRRTRRLLLEGVTLAGRNLDQSIEEIKTRDDFLTGLPGILEGLKSRRIECKVYKSGKFHAKAYISHAREAVIGSAALVGSSNFTVPGLTDNVELNVQIKGREVELLQEWYERHWQDAEDITDQVIRIVERHVQERTPFEVYARAMHEYFRNATESDQHWEESGSKMFGVLDRYQQDGYHNLLKIGSAFGGALLCDGVGLGKTFIGLMLIERLVVREQKNVVLMAPKAAMDSVWRPAIRRHLPHLSGGAFSNIFELAHTDLMVERHQEAIAAATSRAHAVIIDEAHHFRNPGPKGDATPAGAAVQDAKGRIVGEGRSGPSRYRRLFDLIGNGDGRPPKSVFMLTATPINNRLADLRHLIELFSRCKEEHFRDRLGISNVRAHFNQMEKRLDQVAGRRPTDEAEPTDLQEAAQVLAADRLVHSVVVQRSRAFVRAQQNTLGRAIAAFPKREPPQVAHYSLKKVYGRLLDSIDAAFKSDKPLFSLAIYYPLAFYKGPDTSIDPFSQNAQKQVVSLIRTQFLKRFESSVTAFERSCERLLTKLLAWVTVHAETDSEDRQLEQWKGRHADMIGYVQSHQMELFGGEDNDEADDDLVPEEMLEDVERLSRSEYDVPAIFGETMQDLDQIAAFIDQLRKFKPTNDDKLKSLVKLLKTDKVLSSQKVMIFTEFADTARYLEEHLKAADIEGVERVDSATQGKHRIDVIQRFAPYYNELSSPELLKKGKKEIRVLISTDVLSEGLNLQDSTRLINYDIHWNPVRLMQRIGRVDRRLNPGTEARLVTDHPECAATRGKILFWNFLPPDELNELLSLYSCVTHKTLRISKTLGIEGGKLIRHDDDYEDLKHFNETYEGTPSQEEQMRLELDRLFAADPKLEEQLKALPGRIFTGRRHPKAGTRAVFFCFRMPERTTSSTGTASQPGTEEWSTDKGPCRWYLYDLAQTGAAAIVENPTDIVQIIRCTPDEPRHCTMEKPTLSEIRKKIETHIRNTYLKQIDAQANAPKPLLKCWMELT